MIILLFLLVLSSIFFVGLVAATILFGIKWLAEKIYDCL
jgi:hypothetical protein